VRSRRFGNAARLAPTRTPPSYRTRRSVAPLELAARVVRLSRHLLVGVSWHSHRPVFGTGDDLEAGGAAARKRTAEFPHRDQRLGARAPPPKLTRCGLSRPRENSQTTTSEASTPTPCGHRRTTQVASLSSRSTATSRPTRNRRGTGAGGSPTSRAASSASTSRSSESHRPHGFCETRGTVGEGGSAVDLRPVHRLPRAERASPVRSARVRTRTASRRGP